MKNLCQSQDKSFITSFLFEENKIRTAIDENGNPWFFARDVCDLLDISNSAFSRFDLEEYEFRKMYVPTLSNTYGLVSESGLYTLIIRSNKPEAKPFRKWVTSEVLPSIRKKGYYELRQYVCSEPLPYQSRFPKELFEAICRIYNVKPTIEGHKVIYPSFVGGFINKYIYSYFPHRELLPELQNINPTITTKNGGVTRIKKHHQFLTEEKGLHYLDKHIGSVYAILASSYSKDDFKTRFSFVFPEDPLDSPQIIHSSKFGNMMQLTFNFA